MPCIHFAKMPIFHPASAAVVSYEVLLRQCGHLNLQDFNQEPQLFHQHHQELITNLRELDLADKIRSRGQKLFINLLPQQLASSQAMEAVKALHRPPHYPLVIEITEGELSTKPEDMLAALKCIRKSGCQLAIDDFGYGYSNFYRLLEFSPQIVKLDQAFIQADNRQQSRRMQLKQLISLFHHWQKEVIIEGVETREQYQLSQWLGADYVQGYYFGKPQMIE
ncbi:EAL domain-containing protein [Thalassomonas actiniarum]|uniref:EAL domain-containing protein n=1 Tax=Thalassomonas actiniarum TaxID=485447 RepID=A0AAE9YMQ7_9GAMM|nr:EAL domain-containing protein [Thalassomonas actiniarum]WDD98059.1 EAL domain-containing protein [Thalassomonas actiniarum]